MLVHAFYFLQETMHAQRTFSYVSGDLNDFVSPLASLHDSLPHHAACPSDSIVHVNPVPLDLACLIREGCAGH